MDDYKIIFWIIAGLIYLFARNKKKAAPQAPSAAPDESSEESNAPASSPPVTFEDLLREIQGSKKPDRAPVPSQSFPAQPSAQRNEGREQYQPKPPARKQLEDTDYDYREKDAIYGVYEDARQRAFLRPSLEETVKLEDTVVRFKQFNEYQSDVKRNLGEEYMKELKDPRGFKKAFVLSEILKRRF